MRGKQRPQCVGRASAEDPRTGILQEDLKSMCLPGKIIEIETENYGLLVGERTCKPRMDDSDTDIVRCDDGVQSAHEAQYTVL